MNLLIIILFFVVLPIVATIFVIYSEKSRSNNISKENPSTSKIKSDVKLNHKNQIQSKNFTKYITTNNLIILSCILLILLVVFICVSFNKTNLIKIRDKEIYSLNDKVRISSKDIDSYKNEIVKLNKKDEQQKIINNINEIKSEFNELEKEKLNLENKIKSLNSKIIELKGSPKNFPAGEFSAGKDFEPGRYKIYNGNSNFVVYDIIGKLQVNIILGNNAKYNEVKEYLYTFSSGDQVKSNSAFTLVFVE